MILVPLIYAVYGILLVLSSPFLLLPDVEFSDTFTHNIQTAHGYVIVANSFFPLQEIFIVFLGVFLLYEFLYFGYKIMMWIVRKIPTIS